MVAIINYKAIARLERGPLYRNSFFMALTNFFNSFCGFFFWMIATKLYTVEEVGLATALISSLGLVVLFSMLGFDYSIIRFFPTNDKARVFGTSLVITTIVSLLGGTIFILLVEFISPSLALLKEFDYALTFLLIVAVNSAGVIIGTALVANRKADYFFFQNIFIALRIPLLIPLAFLGTFGIFSSLGISLMVASFFALIVLRRSIVSIRPVVDTDFIKRSFRFSSWNYVSNILSIAPTLVLPLIVLNLLGEAEAAKYYIAMAIGNIVFIIPNALALSLFVEGSHGEGLKKCMIRSGGASIAFLVPAVLVIFLFGDQLLRLFGGDYAEAYDLLMVLALSGFLVATYSLFISLQNVRMNVESIAILNAIKCMLLLVLGYIFLHRYGILGVGYGWMISYCVIDICIIWIARQERWIW